MIPHKSLYPFVFLLSVHSAMAHSDTVQEVTLLADEWCPYTCLPDKDKPGILVEVGEMIFANSQTEFNFQLINWSRAVNNVRAGKSQGLLGAYIGDALSFTLTLSYFHKCASIPNQVINGYSQDLNPFLSALFQSLMATHMVINSTSIWSNTQVISSI